MSCRLKDISYKLKYCSKCNATYHRDFVALENIFKKAINKLPEVFKEIENAWRKREKLREAGRKGRMKQLLSRECASPVLRGGVNAPEGDENPNPMKGNSRETKLHQQNIPGETLVMRITYLNSSHCFDPLTHLVVLAFSDE